MKKVVFPVLIFVAAAVCAVAQDYRQKISANPAWAACEMCYYEPSESESTPAPKGYEPFYICHYGRHGSRYMSSSTETDAVRPVFEMAERCGLLTDAGKQYWKDLKAILEEQDGMVGMLTARGAMEHHGMGERMAKNFPQVFKGKRNKVNCVSSTSPRCLISMTNFTDALQENTRGIDFSYTTGPKHYAYLAYHPEVQEGVILSGNIEMDFRRAESQPDELLGHFFNDLEKIKEAIGDPYVFERRLFQLSCMGQLTDYGKCLLEHFPSEVLIRNWEARNARFYVAYSNSKELPHYATDVATPLLKVMLGRMDEALKEGSTTAADLSFGHDVTLMPLIAHIGIEGMHEKLSFDQANARWGAADFICMGSNIQFIFYRNRKGEVLVKILHNEKETSIPALEASYGPFYRWEDLRNYLASSLI